MIGGKNDQDGVKNLNSMRQSSQRKQLGSSLSGENVVDDEAMSTRDSQQHRIEVTRRKNRRHRDNTNMHWFRRIVTLNGYLSTNRVGSYSLSDGVNPNHSIALYLHWMFRVNFFFLFIVMCVAFFVLVLFFSGLITIAGRLDEECVRVYGLTFAENGNPFADAFALSWTTISTVGYGTTYPALGYQNSSPTNCFFINFICSLEALIGILYAGFCGAILFGKVLRIQSYAQVTFSDPILIRYGSGVSGNLDENSPVPFPVLEFRIINRLFNEAGGEILDALLNVVANKTAVNETDLHGESTSEDSRSRQLSTGTISNDHFSSSLRNSQQSPSAQNSNSFKASSIDGQVIDEDLTSLMLNKHIFSKMEIEASEHPFFRRVWVVRHTLDSDSPILKHRVRRQIRRNGNRWPKKLNNARDIRDSLQFNQILVSLTGVSNISACDVYAQKIYDFVDVNIGYEFVNVLYRNSDGSLGVDTDLINDVREQNGGGGEPFITE